MEEDNKVLLPIDVPILYAYLGRKKSSSSDYIFCEGCSDINTYWWTSIKDYARVLTSKIVHAVDRVPVDFPAPLGPTIMTDRDEIDSFLIRVNERNCLILITCHHQKIYNIYVNVKIINPQCMRENEGI
ncbi:Porphobilinogen deaminase [Dirofilaria immitis]